MASLAPSSILASPCIPAPAAVAPSTKKMKSRLFVGEGNFSYTEALLNKHSDKTGLVKAIIATEKQLERPCDCHFTLPNHELVKCNACISTAARIERLKAKGVKIMIGVDATNIQEHFKGKRFQRIHWNIPHDGSDFKAQTLPLLLRQFFYSCASVQIMGDRVHVSLPQPLPDEEGLRGWDFYQGYVYNIISISALAGYQLIKKRKFNTDRYPGYEHIETKKMVSAPVVDKLAREFIFQKVNFSQYISSFEKIENNQIFQDLSIMYAGCPKQAAFKIKEFYKTPRRYCECPSDDDSSDYSDVDSDGEKPVHKEKNDPVAAITNPLQTLNLSGSTPTSPAKTE